MDILYEFDTVGIIYTAVVGGLFLLLLLPTFMFAAKRRQSGAGTVLYRVLDILLLVVLLADWFVYIVGKVELFGLSVKADGAALAFVSDAKTLFSIPYIGSIYGIFDSVLGTVLLGLLSFIAVLTLIFSFAFRRGRKADEAVLVAAAPLTESALDNAVETEVNEEPVPVAENAAAEDAPISENEPLADAVFEETPSAESVSFTVALEPEAETDEPPFTPIIQQAIFAAEAAEDVADTLTPPEKAEEVLVDVEVLDDEEEVLEPVEVLPEEPKYAADDEPRELSSAVKEAIRTVVIDTPQAVKDALRVVLGEDAFIVKEVLRVIVETPTEEPVAPEMPEPVAAVYETAETEPAETAIEAVVATDVPVAAEAAAPAEAEPEVTCVVPEPAAAFEADTTPEAEPELWTEEKGQESVGLIRIGTPPAHKTYSSSLRRPDMKKKNTAAAAK